jgi:hypothetical protein
MPVKDAPVRAVRAAFAGVGRVLKVKDRMSAKPTAPATEAPAEPKAQAATEPSNVRVLDPEAASPETATPETATPETATPETATPETATPETATPETATPETATPETEAAAPADLPLANYDTLTVASLRARLRNLSPGELSILIDYEKAHAGREEVVGMFERRIAKIKAGETTSFQAVK